MHTLDIIIVCVGLWVVIGNHELPQQLIACAFSGADLTVVMIEDLLCKKRHAIGLLSTTATAAILLCNT